MTPEERMRRLRDPERWNTTISPRADAFGATLSSTPRRRWSPLVTLAAVLSIALVVGVGISAAIVGVRNQEAAPVPVPTSTAVPTPAVTRTATPTPTPTPTRTPTPTKTPTRAPAPTETIESMMAKIERAGFTCKVRYDLTEYVEHAAACSRSKSADLAIAINPPSEIAKTLELNRANIEPGSFVVGPNWLVSSSDWPNDRPDPLVAIQKVIGGTVDRTGTDAAATPPGPLMSSAGLDSLRVGEAVPSSTELVVYEQRVCKNPTRGAWARGTANYLDVIQTAGGKKTGEIESLGSIAGGIFTTKGVHVNTARNWVVKKYPAANVIKSSANDLYVITGKSGRLLIEVANKNADPDERGYTLKKGLVSSMRAQPLSAPVKFLSELGSYTSCAK